MLSCTSCIEKGMDGQLMVDPFRNNRGILHYKDLKLRLEQINAEISSSLDEAPEAPNESSRDELSSSDPAMPEEPSAGSGTAVQAEEVELKGAEEPGSSGGEFPF